MSIWWCDPCRNVTGPQAGDVCGDCGVALSRVDTVSLSRKNGKTRLQAEAQRDYLERTGEADYFGPGWNKIARKEAS